MKTHWKKLTNPDYLGAYSLLPGEKRVITIKSVSLEMVKGSDGKNQECTVAQIEGEKPMILNKTNCKIITKLYKTPYIEDWNNKQVIIYAAQVKAFGETVDALRIERKLPELQELTPSHPKWESAKKAIQSGNATIETIRKHYKLSKNNENELQNQM